MNAAQAILHQLLILYSALEPLGSVSTRIPCEISCFPYILEGKGDFNGLFLQRGDWYFTVAALLTYVLFTTTDILTNRSWISLFH